MPSSGSSAATKRLWARPLDQLPEELVREHRQSLEGHRVNPDAQDRPLRPPMTLDVRMLRADEAAVLQRIADGVFDHPIVPAAAAECLRDPRHRVVGYL